MISTLEMELWLEAYPRHLGVCTLHDLGKSHPLGELLILDEQPIHQPNYVNKTNGIGTIYRKPEMDHGVLGILSHVDRSFNFFADVAKSRKVFLVGLDENRTFKVLRSFQIESTREYLAESPSSPLSRLRPLGSKSWQKSTEVYNEIYTGKYPLVLQTCMERFHRPNAGRMFILCEEVTNDSIGI